MDIKLRNLDLAGRIVNLDQPAPASLCLSRPHPDDCAYAGQSLADPDRRRAHERTGDHLHWTTDSKSHSPTGDSSGRSS